jgi:hypothetical protein
MNTARDHRVQAWFHSLREAVASRNEPLYHQRVVEFLLTQEGVLFVQRNLDTPAAHRVMAAVYRRVAPALGINAPEDLLARMQSLGDVPASPESDTTLSRGPDALAPTFMRYLRLGRDWSRGGRLDASYGVALAVFLFEPLLELFEDAGEDPVGHESEQRHDASTTRPLTAAAARYKLFA